MGILYRNCTEALSKAIAYLYYHANSLDSQLHVIFSVLYCCYHVAHVFAFSNLGILL